MSLVSNALATALAAVASAKGEALVYRATIGSGVTTALPGFVLDRDEQVSPFMDEGQMARDYVQTGRVSGPLTPALAIGNGIVDGNGLEWAVERVDFDQQQLATVKRVTMDHAGPDRGGAS